MYGSEKVKPEIYTGHLGGNAAGRIIAVNMGLFVGN